MPAKKKDDTAAAVKQTTKKTTKKTPVRKKATATKKPAKATASSTVKKRTTKKPVAKKAAPRKKTTATARKKVTKVMDAVEHQFDQGMADTQKLLKSKVSKNTKKKVKNLTAKAESVASSIEHLGEEVEHVADSIFPTKSGSQGVYNAQFHKKLSRLFVFRFLWLLIQGPISFVWGIWYAIVTIIHYIYMFIMGKRDRYLWNKQVRFWKHMVSWKSYLNALTDARPEVIHPPVK